MWLFWASFGRIQKNLSYLTDNFPKQGYKVLFFPLPRCNYDRNRRDFKSLRGPNVTKTVILIYNKHIIYRYVYARDARSGPAKKMAPLSIKRTVYIFMPTILFWTCVESTHTHVKKVLLCPQYYYLVEISRSISGRDKIWSRT